jgi:hypothetical protein
VSRVRKGLESFYVRRRKKSITYADLVLQHREFINDLQLPVSNIVMIQMQYPIILGAQASICPQHRDIGQYSSPRAHTNPPPPGPPSPQTNFSPQALCPQPVSHSSHFLPSNSYSTLPQRNTRKRQGKTSKRIHLPQNWTNATPPAVYQAYFKRKQMCSMRLESVIRRW